MLVRDHLRALTLKLCKMRNAKKKTEKCIFRIKYATHGQFRFIAAFFAFLFLYALYKNVQFIQFYCGGGESLRVFVTQERCPNECWKFRTKDHCITVSAIFFYFLLFSLIFYIGFFRCQIKRMRAWGFESWPFRWPASE